MRLVLASVRLRAGQPAGPSRTEELRRAVLLDAATCDGLRAVRVVPADHGLLVAMFLDAPEGRSVVDTAEQLLRRSLAGLALEQPWRLLVQDGTERMGRLG